MIAFHEVCDPFRREVLRAEESEHKGDAAAEDRGQHGQAECHHDLDERVPDGKPVRMRLEEDYLEVSQGVTSGVQNVDASAAHGYQTIDRDGNQHGQRDPRDPFCANIGFWGASRQGQGFLPRLQRSFEIH